MKRHQILRLTGLMLFLKGAYLCIAFAWSGTVGPLDGRGLVERTFVRNDAAWYLSIAERGYPVIRDPDDLGCCRPDCFRQSSYAFFPLFPLLIRASSATLLSPASGAVFLAFVLSVAVVLFFGYFVALWSGDAQAGYRSAVLLAIFPFHFFFSMAYTESLFLLLLLLCFYYLHQRRYLGVSVSFALLILTRPNGVAVGLPLLMVLSVQALGTQNPFRRLIQRQWIWILPAFAFASLLYFMFLQTGDPLAFVQAQEGWCKQPMFPLFALFRSGDLAHQFLSYYTLVFTLGAVLLLWKGRCMPVAWHVWIWIGLMLPLSAGSVVSMPRYISVLFPFFAVAGTFHLKRGVWLSVFALLLSAHLLSFLFWLKDGNLLGM